MSKWMDFSRFARNESGLAAIEMGLTAPVIFLGFAMMLDVGTAVGERMSMDRFVRAGVQAVMSNVTDPTDVKNAVVAAANGATGMNVAVNKSCICGSSGVSCTSWCSADKAPSVYLNISATKYYSGLMLPTFQMESKTHVQLR